MSLWLKADSSSLQSRETNDERQGTNLELGQVGLRPRFRTKRFRSPSIPHTLKCKVKNDPCILSQP